jgi:putative hydrolase of the HAD superfamily
VARTRTTHIMFDLFGTLVSYHDSEVAAGFRRSHDVVRKAGSTIGYDDFCATWGKTFDEFERRATASHDEFSMTAICAAFLERVIGRQTDRDTIDRFRQTYLEEWSTGVRLVPGVAETIDQLSGCYRLGVITNTHDGDFARRQLSRTGVADRFRLIVTSIEHGKRKPSPFIFRHAVKLAGANAKHTVFVGDSYDADYCGAVGAGLGCLLIDPERRHKIPESDRIDSITDLPSRLMEVV